MIKHQPPKEVAVSPEEVIAELEKKVARLETALEGLLDALIGATEVPVTVAIAAGEAWNVVKGIG